MAQEAKEYLEATRLVASRSEPSSAVSDTIFAVAARVLVWLFAAYAAAEFWVRQIVYSAQRSLIYARRTPAQIRSDVTSLAKIPRHVAFILDVRKLGFDGLVVSTSKLSSWCLGAGIPQLTVYERTGLLQVSAPLSSVAEAVVAGLSEYFGRDGVPLIEIRSGRDTVRAGGQLQGSDAAGPDASGVKATKGEPALLITLACEREGRPLMAELAQEYTAEVSANKLDASSIDVPRVHEDIRARVGDEPDLLVTFASRLDLDGFQPWLLRVTELFCLPDNNGVLHYLVFYRALQKFSTVKVNLGA